METPSRLKAARVEDLDKIRGLGLGADGYIVKPFSPMELVAWVKAHLSRYERLTERNKNEEQEMAIGDIRINPKSHRVYIREREVSLKNKEYELLLFLVTNADIVFNREALYFTDNHYCFRQCGSFGPFWTDQQYLSSASVAGLWQYRF